MKNILVIPGDGIGPEVMAEAKKLIQAISLRLGFGFELHEVDWGAEKWLREGVGIPVGVLPEIPKKYDAILFGALGDKRIPDMAHGRAILLGLRTGLDLFINLRPVKLAHSRLGILKNCELSDIDMVIFRENTQDIYAGAGGVISEGSESEVAIDESIHSYFGVHRIIKAAFEYAQKHGRKKVTLVDKSNAIKFGGKLWQRVFWQVAKNYSTIKADHLFIDVAAMKMVQNPQFFDVLVTSNLFGDILSDLGAGIAGGLGLAASANINTGTIALFEPVHGSAPDLAGLGLANPFAMFMSVALMSRYFDLEPAALAIEQSIFKAIDARQTTRDLGGDLNCRQAANFVIENLLL